MISTFAKLTIDVIKIPVTLLIFNFVFLEIYYLKFVHFSRYVEISQFICDFSSIKYSCIETDYISSIDLLTAFDEYTS